MRRLRLSLLSAGLVLCVFVPHRAGTPVQAAQVLQNGGFESGLSGWLGSNLAASGCPAHLGSGALNLSPTADLRTSAHQEISISAGQGPYTLSGFARSAGSATPALRVILQWLDAGGAGLADGQTQVSLSSSYAAFNLTAPAAPFGTAVISLRIDATGSGSACIDDLSLDGPAPIAPTVVPTATPTSPPTQTPSRTPTTPRDTATPRPPTSTKEPSATRPPASATRSSSGAAAAGDVLVNGGFESGLAPWQKFGGELSTTSAPARSGSAAGVLASTTTSTKWAYQVVRVNAGDAYAFEGYLQPGTGVAEAYLRISWYASNDGSGSAIANTDSTQRASTGVPSFVYLSSGSVQAPAGANSARARIMLAPQGAGYAAVFMDDLAFGPSTAPARADAVRPQTPEDQPDTPVPGPATDQGAGLAAQVRGVSREPTSPPRPALDSHSGALSATPLPETALDSIEQKDQGSSKAGAYGVVALAAVALIATLALMKHGRRWRAWLSARLPFRID